MQGGKAKFQCFEYKVNYLPMRATGFILPIVVAYMEVTPVILSLSPIQRPFTKLLWNCPAPEDFVNVTYSVLTCIGGMVMISFGFLNRMWLTIIPHTILAMKQQKLD